MKIPMLRMSLFLWSVGCAGVPVRATVPAPSAAGETKWESCFPGRSYNDEETTKVLQMADEGATAKEIARKVGGEPQDVRCWAARASHHQPRTSSQLADLAKSR